MNVFEVILELIKNGALMVEVFTGLVFSPFFEVPGFGSMSIFQLFINPLALSFLMVAVFLKKVVPLLWSIKI